MHRQAWLLGARRSMQCSQARMDRRHRWMSQRGGYLHRLHDAGLPGSFHAVHGRAARRHSVVEPDQALWSPYPHAASFDHVDPQQRAKMAAQPANIDHRLPTATLKKRRFPPSYSETVMSMEAPTTAPIKRPSQIVEMNWDPITRIVGSLGIYTKIDFGNRIVTDCHATSSIFRGYSIFLKGKDPRDAHFLTSRICGICGDNHATCSVYAQNMAYGIKPPAIAEWITNLGEAAEYMFDHNIFQDNLVGVDFCEKMVRETNPGVWEKAKATEAPHAKDHGYRTIGDIMVALNPFSGEFYRETLQVSRYTREMFCLMEGRHVHPSTLYPGGVGTVPTVQVFTDYLVRLMKYVEFMKKVVPLHDDLFDFFYEALPGYEKVGERRILTGCWGSFNDPDHCDYQYRHMTDWGRKMFVTPGVVIDNQLVTTDLVDINLNIRILLGSSFYDDWESSETFVTRDPLGNPVHKRHPWNQTTIPRPQKREMQPGGKYSWTMSPRWLHQGDHLALDTGGGAYARLLATALANLVDIGYVKATGTGVKMYLPRTA